MSPLGFAGPFVDLHAQSQRNGENEKVCTVGAEYNGEIEIAVCGKYYNVPVE